MKKVQIRSIVYILLMSVHVVLPLSAQNVSVRDRIIQKMKSFTQAISRFQTLQRKCWSHECTPLEQQELRKKQYIVFVVGSAILVMISGPFIGRILFPSKKKSNEQKIGAIFQDDQTEVVQESQSNKAEQALPIMPDEDEKEEPLPSSTSKQLALDSGQEQFSIDQHKIKKEEKKQETVLRKNIDMLSVKINTIPIYNQEHRKTINSLRGEIKAAKDLLHKKNYANAQQKTDNISQTLTSLSSQIAQSKRRL